MLQKVCSRKCNTNVPINNYKVKHVNSRLWNLISVTDVPNYFRVGQTRELKLSIEGYPVLFDWWLSPPLTVHVS